MLEQTRDFLYLKISKIMNINKKIFQQNIRKRPESSEVERLVCANHKMIKLSKWKPDHDIETGLKLTIDWFIENNSQLKPEIFNV